MLTAMIFAKDHDTMVAFYQRGFDLEVDADASTQGYTVLTGEATRVSIHAIAPHLADEITIASPPEARTHGAVKLLFEVTDLSTTCDRLEHLGGQRFETTGDDATDVVDVEGNVFRVNAAS